MPYTCKASSVLKWCKKIVEANSLPLKKHQNYLDTLVDDSRDKKKTKVHMEHQPTKRKMYSHKKRTLKEDIVILCFNAEH